MVKGEFYFVSQMWVEKFTIDLRSIHYLPRSPNIALFCAMIYP